MNINNDQIRRQGNSHDVVATLDLHGLNKEDAISLLTTFLSKVLLIKTAAPPTKQQTIPTSVKSQLPQQQKNRLRQDDKRNKVYSSCSAATGNDSNNTTADGIWVLIIAGKGNHSKDGPVIRTAVTSILDKRCMTYKLTNGKGCFLVRADSGHELQTFTPLDTKIVVVQEEEFHCTTSLDANDSKHQGTPVFCTADDPLPSQVHAGDEDLELAKKLSAHEEQLRRRDFAKKQMQQGLDDSLLTAATAAAGQIYHKSSQDEYEEIQTALRQSIKDKDNEELQQELELKRALSASQLQQEEDDYYRLTSSYHGSNSEMFDAEDDLLLLARVLNLSKDVQQISEQEIIKIAIEKSVNEF